MLTTRGPLLELSHFLALSKGSSRLQVLSLSLVPVPVAVLPYVSLDHQTTPQMTLMQISARVSARPSLRDSAAQTAPAFLSSDLL